MAASTDVLYRLRGAWGLARSLAIYRRPGRQRALRRFYRAFIGPGDLVFDIGAHLGDRTVAFSALGARVIALEPQPRLHAWLQRVAARHPSVTALPLAVGAEAGGAELAVSAATPTVSTLAAHWRTTIGHHNPAFRHVRWEDRVTVAVTTLDALIARYGVPRFCKIDVEGYEAEVLAALKQPIPALSVEFVAGAVSVAEACIARLAALGDYRFNVIGGEGRRFLWPEWTSEAAARRWLADGAGGFASGDLYARLVRDERTASATNASVAADRPGSRSRAGNRQRVAALPNQWTRPPTAR